MNCNIFLEVEVEVEYDYQPEEPARDDCPGCPLNLRVNSVKLLGQEIMDRLTESELDSVWSDCLANEADKTIDC